jgi:hypothetical protein
MLGSNKKYLIVAVAMADLALLGVDGKYCLLLLFW